MNYTSKDLTVFWLHFCPYSLGFFFYELHLVPPFSKRFFSFNLVHSIILSRFKYAVSYFPSVSTLSRIISSNKVQYLSHSQTWIDQVTQTYRSVLYPCFQSWGGHCHLTYEIHPEFANYLKLNIGKKKESA